MLVNFERHLTSFKWNKIKKYKDFNDIYRGIIGELLLRIALSKETKIMVNDLKIEFKFDNFGKPSLLNFHNKCFFNISHSGKWAVCVIGENCSVGVDIEEVKKIDLNLAKVFFSKSEYEKMLSIENEEIKLSYFYDIWTLKERYVKAIGVGLNLPFHTFDIPIKGGIMN